MDRKIRIIGGANIDICGRSVNELKPYNSNPGEMTFSFGGVGRNISEVICRLGQPVQFVTCFSSDYYGKQLRQNCIDLGMDISLSKVVDNKPTSTYLAIMDENGDMYIAMSDMRLLQEMDSKMLDEAISNLNKDDILVLDANLEEEKIEYLATNASCLKAADPVSISKVTRFIPVLDKLDIFKPNQYEAKELNGIEVKDEVSAKESLTWFKDKGVKETIISMDAKGVLLGYQGNMYWFKHRAVNLVNANGGGDYFTGAYLYQRLQGVEPIEASKYAIAAAITRIENSQYIIDKDIIYKNIDTLDIEVKQL